MSEVYLCEDNKIDVIMPMLGGGTRMKGMQNTCKPLYKLPDGTPLFIKALESLKEYNIYRLVLVVLKQYEDEFRQYATELKEKTGAEVYIVSHEPTKCQVDSFKVGLKFMDDFYYRFPIISLDCDITGDLPLVNPHSYALFGFYHDNPNKSFIKYEDNKVTDIVEKRRISNRAVFGAYYFSKPKYIETLLSKGEYEYMSDIYRKLLEENEEILWYPAENVVNYGTKEEWEESTRITKEYKAFLFDFDGTLFDTKELNFKAYQLAYFDLGVTINRKMFKKTDGLVVSEFNQAMGVECDLDKLKELKHFYYKDLVKYAEPNKYLINLIKKTNLKTALVTTARKTNIDALLYGYSLKFDAMVTQEDVHKHKPAPDAYIRAIEELGVNPEECLVFEDSRPGFVAARRAGCDCVMVKEFQDDCVRNMSGGSDATTKLLVIGNKLLVRKEAFGEKQAKRLENQCKKLLEESQNPSYIDVVDHDKDKDWFMYDMVYKPAPSLHEYINKIKLLPELLDKLWTNAIAGHKRLNKEDIRQFCLDTYIRPGMEIYQKVTGRTLDPIYTNACYIPEFVNDFRITTYHGDSTLENVLVERDGKLLFIDPVPDGNAVNGLVHDYSKVAQSLTGYEAIRDGVEFDYTVERRIFDKYAFDRLTTSEYQSLKFHTACLLFRRLKHQIEQNPSLVETYGDIAWQLLSEFAQGKYNWD